jgi:hypothetical protein
MMTFILLAVLSADCPPQAPPINPRLAVGYCSLVAHRCKKEKTARVECVKPAKVAEPEKSLCVCTDTGVCECTGGQCGCVDCPSVKKAPKPKKMKTVRVFSHYERACNGRSCSWRAVYQDIPVEDE